MTKTGREEGFAELAEWFEALAKVANSHASRLMQGYQSITGQALTDGE
jgi:hypothetical protein